MSDAGAPDAPEPGTSRGGRARTSRGERTREHIIDVAERLYGERGVESVSLREIRIAAGQRNASALHFHFGDREGLLLAIVDRHLPQLIAIQRGLYDEMILEGRQRDPRSLVEVLLRPSALYLCRGPSERAWIKLVGELAAKPELEFRTIVDWAADYALAVGTELYELLCEQMPDELAVDRLFTVTLSFASICADRARVEDADDTGREHLALDRWIDNLMDMAHGALFAPVSHPQISVGWSAD
jgi:AcrR family transcriptional regulator